jgi:hypothetical protein
MDVVGAQVTERAAAGVLEFDPARAPRRPSKLRVAASERLELGLLVCRDDVLVGPSGTPSTTRAYKSSTLAALAAKSGSRGKIHDR